ncbi:natural resistance-associated macrophage protein [Saitoella complicata NRRL Y-17804]|uniref:Natural resistance-associated macrophage protein n=1 Tax=Saitoella complicata (strain BCRC 22490 / CBS 7301 / JCM 7358 / NBRC 10748 / NRRL Y-17804) TaxID=698492 RepID=A0A0E9NPC9_SAICN|nr:natural resistance-associated macrophage protein [Saitoella complicata NRRL Y-17804]ODQ51115.1 natural resistance-associated macrophage protein [Saitoella complicata NRRL Y-17804]GAO51285.1 hypothetical protein G7K_5390-t1 [Saitoella complicata NRRL Y-17804]
MNCPSRETSEGRLDYFQGPPHLPSDTISIASLNDDGGPRPRGSTDARNMDPDKANNHTAPRERERWATFTSEAGAENVNVNPDILSPRTSIAESAAPMMGNKSKLKDYGGRFMRAVGPGVMLSVAYMDPGNYSTDVAAGAEFRFKLLFVIMLSNVFAVVLQSLAAKLGSVTGMDLARCCRAYFPVWVCWGLYVLSEAAIIATDLAEVVGTAIALNILLKIPLIVGTLLTVCDVLVVLFFYQPEGTMKGVRAFEAFVGLLVLAVVVCFIIELVKIPAVNPREVLKGYLPSGTVFKDGLYASIGILGATVMPHSLFLGSGLVQSRLRDYDVRMGNYEMPEEIRRHISEEDIGPKPKYLPFPRIIWKLWRKWILSREPAPTAEQLANDLPQYKPTYDAINHTLLISVVEIGVSLFTFALFVNSAILIVAGATLSETPQAKDADLFSIHQLLSEQLAPAAGTLFALALLCSGQSAGVVATMAGQMVSEGFLRWKIIPWLRRLITRAIAITPVVVIAAAVGRKGLGELLNASQVVLSVLLPFVSFPLIWFTSQKKYMRVPVLARPVPARANSGDVVVDTSKRPEVGAAVKDNDESTMSIDVLSPGTGPSHRRTGTVTTISDNCSPGTEIEIEYIDMSNGWTLTIVSWAIWGIISGLNVYLIVLLGLGNA